MKLRANKGVGDAVERDNCDVHRCALETDELENVEKLVTHRFGLEDTRRAFEMMARGVDENGEMVLKVMVGPRA